MNARVLLDAWNTPLVLALALGSAQRQEINAADGSVASFGFCSECWQLLVDFHFHVLAGKLLGYFGYQCVIRRSYFHGGIFVRFTRMDLELRMIYSHYCSVVVTQAHRSTKQLAVQRLCPSSFEFNQLVLPSAFQHQAACSTGGMLTEITLRFVGKEAYGKVLSGSCWCSGMASWFY